MSDGKVVFDIVADDSGAVKQVEQAGQKLGTTAEKSFGGVKTAAKVAVTSVAAVGGAFVAAGGFALNSATNMSQAMNQFQAATGVADAELEAYQDTLESIYANNYGESFEDVADAMGKVKQQLGDISQEDLQTLTEGLYTLEDTFDSDFNETLRGTDQLMTQFGLSATDALDLMASGMQNGLNYTDELGDNISEYAGKFAQAGYSAEEYFQLLKNGSDGGAYNLDKINDAINEVTTRLADGTIEESLGSFNQETQDVFKAWQNGEATQKDVIDSIVKNISNCKNEQEALTLAATAFGTMGEDANLDFVKSLTSVGDEFEDVAGKMDEVSQIKYDDLGSMLDGLKRTVELLAVPLGEMLIPALTELGESVQPVLSALSETLGPLLTSIMETLPTLFSMLTESMGPMMETMGESLIPIIQQVLEVFTALSGPLQTLWQLNAAISETLFGLLEQILPPLLEIITGLLEPLMQLVDGLLGPLAEMIEALLGPMSDLISTALEPILNLFTSLLTPVQTLISSMLPPLQELFSGLSPILTEILGELEPMLQFFTEIGAVVAETLSPVLTTLASVFGDILGVAIDTVLGLLDSFQTLLSGVIDFITGVFTGDWETAWNGVVDIFKGIFNLIPTAVETVINSVIGVINGMINGVNNVTGKIGISAIPTISEVSLPKFHTGGVVDFEAGEGVALLKDGEMVLTQAQQGMLFDILNGGVASAESPQPQKVTVVVRAEPREMAHAITPYIEDEQQRMDRW